jgi:hypothetical protein
MMKSASRTLYFCSFCEVYFSKWFGNFGRQHCANLRFGVLFSCALQKLFLEIRFPTIFWDGEFCL